MGMGVSFGDFAMSETPNELAELGRLLHGQPAAGEGGRAETHTARAPGRFGVEWDHIAVGDDADTLEQALELEAIDFIR